MRTALALVAAFLTSLLTLAVAPAGPAAAAPADNPWLDMRVMNMAHSGGESEAPMNTLYAFKRAKAIGADMLELDVQSTADGQVVVIHNATVDDSTEGTGRVVDKTLAEVQSLDAAYWFVPGMSTEHGQPESAYTLRGARNGEVTVPGYTEDDFAIPTMQQVLDAFPDTPINIEIKGTRDSDAESYLRTGRLLADLVNESGRTDLIVGSFNDAAIADFHERAPQIGLSTGRQATTDYVLFQQQPPPGTVALQVPVNQMGIRIITKDFVARAHRDGLAVHAWFSGTAPDDADTYNAMINTCVDGLMPSRPTLLESILDERGIERPGSGQSGTVPGCAEEPTSTETTDPTTDPTDPTTGPTDPTSEPTQTSEPTPEPSSTSPGGPGETTYDDWTTAPITSSPARPEVVQTDGGGVLARSSAALLVVALLGGLLLVGGRTLASRGRGRYQR